MLNYSIYTFIYILNFRAGRKKVNQFLFVFTYRYLMDKGIFISGKVNDVDKCFVSFATGKCMLRLNIIDFDTQNDLLHFFCHYLEKKMKYVPSSRM